jgi:hypothetical protein
VSERPGETPGDVPTEPMPVSDSADSSPTSVVDAVFGEGSYRAVSDDSAASTLTQPKSLTQSAAGQNIFVALWVLGTVIVLAAMVGAFLLGNYVAGGSGPSVEEEPEASIIEDRVVFPELGGLPQEPGVWAWDALRGGECLADFESAFAEEYQVVSCAGPYQAQLVKAQLLSDDPDASYPGEAEVLATSRAMCEVREVIDFAVAAEYSDLIVDFSYPVSVDQWNGGARAVYCFVLRSSGEPLQGSLVN